jgi:polyketide synthase PksL
MKMPEAERSGFVVTLNKMGWMTSSLDRFSRAFVDEAAAASAPSLDVGAAYGVATLAALARGARVIANDLDARHLDILAARVPAEARDRLTLAPGAFPDGIELPPASVGAALASRVLHFLDGPAIERGAARLFSWLEPGGRVFVTAETPWLGNMRAFASIYEARRAAGERWPGQLDDVQKVAPERGRDMPARMHFLDPEVLARTFTEAGFTVEEAATFARPEFPDDVRLDGRESVGLIARRPPG